MADLEDAGREHIYEVWGRVQAGGATGREVVSDASIRLPLSK
jgi:hypothetical protein